MEETIKIEVDVKIKYKDKSERKEALKIAKHNILGDEYCSSTISVKPIKARIIK